MKNSSKAHAKRVDLISDYKKVFESPEGERVLFDLMKKGHFMHTSFQGDVEECLFREGERNIINYILTIMKQDPVAVKAMIETHEQQELDYA